MSFSKKFAINYWLGHSFMPPSIRLKLIKEIGFNSIELYWADEYQEVNGGKDEIAHECLEQGLQISCLHTTFNRSGLLWEDSLDGEGLFNEYIQSIVDASRVDCKCIVMHFNGTGDYVVFKNRINMLQSMADEFGITLCAENLPHRDNLNFICQNTSMGLCCDIGHYNIRRSVEIERNIDRIKYIHLHDNHGKTDSHLLPGEGNINYMTRPIAEILRLPCEILLEVHNTAVNPNSTKEYIEYLKRISTENLVSLLGDKKCSGMT